jgi:hypothetical protein
VWRRIDEDGVEDDDDRNGEPLQDGEDLVAVGPAVDAVLVLDDDGVEAVENGGRLRFAARRAGDEVMHDLGSDAALEPVDHPNHADVAAGRPRLQFPRQGGGEGGQPAFGGRVGGQESVAHGHRRTASWLEGRRLSRRGDPDKTRFARGLGALRP